MLESHAEGVVVSVSVVPGARATEIAVISAGVLRMRVAAPAVGVFLLVSLVCGRVIWCCSVVRRVDLNVGSSVASRLTRSRRLWVCDLIACLVSASRHLGVRDAAADRHRLRMIPFVRYKIGRSCYRVSEARAMASKP